jgi:TetR/AcrR family transcriptional regulator, regulator of cefoperazone and chloramphenicol sensitivity
MPNVTAPRRHPEQGGYARGEETRARIIMTALRIFGEHGYDQASTRQIAAEAGVNPPALQYYFHSKEGLHLACAQHIIDRVGTAVAPAFERAAEAVRGGAKQDVLAALLFLLDALADGFAAAGSENWSRFIVRGRVDGAGPAISLLRERIGTPLFEVTAQLVGSYEGRTTQDETVRLRALAIMGQVNWLHANHDNTLAMMRWNEFDARNLALIKAVVREHTQAILQAAAAASTEPSAVDSVPARSHEMNM